jgi:hypothetical protein
MHVWLNVMDGDDLEVRAAMAVLERVVSEALSPRSAM